MLRLVMWCVAALVGVAAGRADDPLWDRFQTPPAEARPLVRWWWNGNAVEADEIARQIEVLHQAGLGGVEICPTAMPPGAQPHDAPGLKWLSPEWCQMLKAASEAATAREMHVDLVAGCGRPWGGDFLAPEHVAQRVELITRRIKGPTDLKLTREELLKLPPPPVGRATAKEQPPVLLFLRLMPVGCTKTEEVIDLLGAFDQQGQLTAKVPEGEFTLCTGIVRKGFLAVQPSAESAGRPVVDHLNQVAVRSYLDHISSSVRTALNDDLGKFVQTLVCDDGNLSGANWTGDFAEEFKRRSGYELEPYLPFVVDFKQKLPMAKEFAATIARVRHDYAKTLAELFQDRFVETFHKWCGEQGTKSRLRPGNSGSLAGLADLLLVPDVPQGSSYLYVGAGHGSPVWSKYATSAGHLAERRVISTAAMLNTRGVFKESLGQIKAAGDRNFLRGGNHTVLHGFNYSPREVGFPGWVRSGSYFSPSSTWWPYLPRWNDYNARLSSVFLNSRPVAQVAILAPTADVWSQSGLSAKAFQQSPWYVHQLSQALSQHGCSADFVSQRVLQRAKYEQGKLCYGSMKYDALVIVDAQSLAPATTSALVLFADGGGRMAFVGRKPSRAPGMNNVEQRDQAVVQAMQHLAEKKPAGVVELAPPAKPADLPAWTSNLINKLGVPRSIAFDKPAPDLQQVHYRHEDRDIFFVVNTSGERTVSTTASFAAAGPHAWRWDPETGERAVYPTSNKKARVDLGPHQSLLLVFEPAEPPADTPRIAPAVQSWQETFTLPGPWVAEFAPVVGEKFSMPELVLGNLGESPDERVQHFAGTVTYRTRFDLAEVPSGRVMIDLGKVHDLAEVHLNGEPLGSVWYGQQRFDATRRLSAGANMLEIRVATPLFNYTQSLKDNPTATYWTERAASKELVPAGLAGPVRLVTPAKPDAEVKE